MVAHSRTAFLAVAFIFHVVYILSIFDIYFVSPIVSGMRLFPVERKAGVAAPADRLVLFVGDGLRADKALQSFPDPFPESADDLEPRPLAPFLRSRILEHGTFGVSHTRVPTESRPGHVALIAGLYEDVSAVMTGWKLNPVNFDSVFNRSRHTWSWGSPDILPMFEQGAVPGRVDSYTYGHEFEDFSQDALELDLWVFDHVKDFFAEAAKNETLRTALQQDKLVFFLHLLGIDTAGHSHRPYSKEYLNNIKVVDKGVQEVTQLFHDFYGDDRTAFVFTADHGMSDWGSHGDGHPNNTRTPLIAWGSGVASPIIRQDAIAAGHDEYSSDWNLDHVQRNDVAQADIAALMSYLIGTEFPANSVGELPLAYLSADIETQADMSLINARAILEQYHVKEEQKRAKELRFRPYGQLSGTQDSSETRLAAIQHLISSGRFEEAIEESAALMKLALDGMRYLQTYDWLFLRTLVTLGYLGWMAYALTSVIDLHVLRGTEPPARTFAGIIFFSAALTTLYASLLVSGSPATYYAYAFFPAFFWEEVYARRNSIRKGCQLLFGHVRTASDIWSLVLDITVYVGVIVLLALAYIHREILTALYLVGALWPASYGLNFLRANPALSSLWVVSCLAMSVFTLLPANKLENIDLILAGGSLMLAVGLIYLVFEDRLLHGSSKPATSRPLPIARVLTGIQVGLIGLAMAVTRTSSSSLQAKAGLPRGAQVVGWITTAVSLAMPLAHRLQPNGHYIHRLVVMFLTCAPTFVILTISYEGLFYVAFSLLLFCWLELESKVFRSRPPGDDKTQKGTDVSEVRGPAANQTTRPLTLADARIALFFLILLKSAFFSTGNIASVSSFSLESVNRLFPVFDPLSQGALLTLKLMIPFALISANLGILNRRLRVAPSALFMVVMATSDVLTLYFFWVVKDEGSWLEIGSTISHFVIASVLCAFLAGLEGVSGLFIEGIEEEGLGSQETGPTTPVSVSAVDGQGNGHADATSSK
ncbi:phosphatidylinositolglycan class N [Plectosphaerella plurivora]|uniref:GPI ethanolamine phosphate transferase 1 n=1 Tax=Plectosphaerella plurivora TaxID=936078 RepID=A0A9P8VBI2_9PEZI|nr:phosphatidylinositolglycan class N [Plectosphaerella plurivora]